MYGNIIHVDLIDVAFEHGDVGRGQIGVFEIGGWQTLRGENRRMCHFFASHQPAREQAET